MLRNAQRRTVPTQLLGFDQPSDPAIDRLARLAPQRLRAPMALVAIVDIGNIDVIAVPDHENTYPVSIPPARSRRVRRAAYER